MNYEQKYKEALNKIKPLYEQAKRDGNPIWSTYEYLIPELRESEDERIRKGLIKLVKDTLPIATGTDRDVLLAWLEKQKEPENVSASTMIPSCWVKDPDKCPEFCVRSHCFGCPNYEQKEQKPNIELIKRSWYMEGYTDGEFKREPMWNLVTGKGGPKYEKNEKYGQPLEQKEQKPIQTEEEREYIRTLKGLISDFIHNSCSSITDGIGYIDVSYYQKIYDWLEGRYDGQKPAEWSEEDEKMNKEIRLYLKQDRTDFPGRAERINKMIEWLINICPNSQWKPSEEQMEALEETINQDCVVCNGDRKWIKPNLESLYEQLKKMKAPRDVPPIESIQK